MPVLGDVFDVVDVGAVRVWDVLEFPEPVGRFEVHAITRHPVPRRFPWRPLRSGVVTFWSDDRYRDETMRHGPDHFVFTPGARRQTVPAHSHVLRRRR